MTRRRCLPTLTVHFVLGLPAAEYILMYIPGDKDLILFRSGPHEIFQVKLAESDRNNTEQKLVAALSYPKFRIRQSAMKYRRSVQSPDSSQQPQSMIRAVSKTSRSRAVSYSMCD